MKRVNDIETIRMGRIREVVRVNNDIYIPCNKLFHITRPYDPLKLLFNITIFSFDSEFITKERDVPFLTGVYDYKVPISNNDYAIYRKRFPSIPKIDSFYAEIEGKFYVIFLCSYIRLFHFEEIDSVSGLRMTSFFVTKNEWEEKYKKNFDYELENKYNLGNRLVFLGIYIKNFFTDREPVPLKDNVLFTYEYHLLAYGTTYTPLRNKGSKFLKIKSGINELSIPYMEGLSTGSFDFRKESKRNILLNRDSGSLYMENGILSKSDIVNIKVPFSNLRFVIPDKETEEIIGNRALRNFYVLSSKAL